MEELLKNRFTKKELMKLSMFFHEVEEDNLSDLNELTVNEFWQYITSIIEE